jgi:hypothetical protein
MGELTGPEVERRQRVAAALRRRHEGASSGSRANPHSGRSRPLRRRGPDASLPRAVRGLRRRCRAEGGPPARRATTRRELAGSPCPIENGGHGHRGAAGQAHRRGACDWSRTSCACSTR